jgi:hypothetical protein
MRGGDAVGIGLRTVEIQRNRDANSRLNHAKGFSVDFETQAEFTHWKRF